MADRYQVIPRTHSYVFHEEHVLLIKGSSGKPWANKFNALGGHIEKGEDIVAAADREIREETGLEAQDTRLAGIIHVTNFYAKNIIMFVTSSRSISTQVTANHEGELVWVEAGKIGDYPVLPDVEAIIARILTEPDEVFTATSQFSDDGQLIDLAFHT